MHAAAQDRKISEATTQFLMRDDLTAVLEAIEQLSKEETCLHPAARLSPSLALNRNRM